VEKLKPFTLKNWRRRANRRRHLSWLTQRLWHMLRGECLQYSDGSASVYGMWNKESYPVWRKYFHFNSVYFNV